MVRVSLVAAFSSHSVKVRFLLYLCLPTPKPLFISPAGNLRGFFFILSLVIDDPVDFFINHFLRCADCCYVFFLASVWVLSNSVDVPVSSKVYP